MDYEIPLSSGNEPSDDPPELTAKRSSLQHAVDSDHPSPSWQQQVEAMRAQLIEAKKMATIGHMTAGIGHEIKNLISFITSSVGPLQLDFAEIRDVIEGVRKLKSSQNPQADLEGLISLSEKLDTAFLMDEINTLLNGLDEGARRAGEIVSGLKHFSRSDDPDFVMANLHRELDATLRLLKHKIPNNLTIDRQYNAIPEIWCIPGKLNQVFMNILSNAIQAVEEQEPSQGNIHISTELIASDWLRIRIRDNGIGMTEEVISHIFDPFFTTKSIEKGNGLGLSICMGFIQLHNGTIQVSSQPGKGAEFEINLPIHQPDLH